MWCGVNKCPFSFSSISPNRPGAKSVMGHIIESIPSPKQESRPLPSLLSSFSSMVVRVWYGHQ